MPSTDDRIVAMQFDNKSFEEKLSTTMGSLDKLKASLDFANANKSMGDLTRAAGAFNLQGIASAVEGIGSKFTAMGAIAFSVIQSITTKAIDAGISIVKSLSLDQVISGFREYETNMNAIQTVLANTRADGTNLQDVNAALDTLNQYSDQTIYNFGEMARNIGTFTAAGVDLDTSVNSIKGIANLAAISGSNSQQASTAMYQLSQALASGSVKLMDWNSIVNAGMGGEVFQKALFTTGQALGTIKDLPMGQTFDEWKAAGNTFRGSLEEGWLTAEVLTNTLSGFTGDLTEAQILSMGYTKEQAAEILELGKTGKDAATKVKTLTQLIGTVKESIGSGWSSTFRILIGDFDQAKELFTDLNNVIGGFVGRNADARNEMLHNFAFMGGRENIILGVKVAFEALGRVLEPIGEAFRTIFPKTTADQLFKMSEEFVLFTKRLRITEETGYKIKAVFAGVFAALEIGWTILKETAGLIGDLFSSFSDSTGSAPLDFLEEMGLKLVKLNGALVAGGGIKDFFAGLSEAIKDPGQFVDDLREKIQFFFDIISGAADRADFSSFEGITAFFEKLSGWLEKGQFTILSDIATWIGGLFDNFDLETSNSMEGGLSRLGDRLTWFGDVMTNVWGAFQSFWDHLVSFKDGVKEAIGGVKDAFSNIGPDIVAALGDLDFDQVLELIQTAIAGVFAGGFSNISKNGLQFDFTGGALSGLADIFREFKGIGKDVKDTLGEVTDTLEAMQLKLKAEALQKIAIAMGILAVSMILLSTVDPEALGKALVAMGVGFGQLATTMAILTKVASGPKSAATLGVLATGLILLAGAILVLSVAMKILSTMDLEELAKGLGAIAILLTGLTIASKFLSANSAGMVKAGAGILLIAVALNLLAGAVKLFSLMSWEEMGQGLVGIAGGLLIIAAAMNLMPSDMSGSVAILVIAVALNVLALAVKSFAEMDMKEMGKGMLGIAAGLLIIAGAMHLMPANMLLTSIGLVAVGVALNLMASALKIMATMSWGEIAKGLTAMAGALLIIAIAAHVMEGAILGAIGITLMSVALGLLVKVLKEFAKLSWSELLKGLVGLAATLLVLAGLSYILAPLVVTMLGLGAAMLLMGAGFALFGLGAQVLATAFGLIAAAGKEGIDVVMYAIDQLLIRLPEMAQAFSEALIFLAQTILDAIPDLVKSLGDIIIALLQVIIDSAPKIAEAFVALVEAGITAIREIVPDIISLGLDLLIALLQGISDNIEMIVTTVGDIIIKFLTSMTEKMPDIVTAGVDLVVAFIQGITDNIQKVINAGFDLIVKILEGIADKVDDVGIAATDMVVSFITSMTNMALSVIAAGTDMIIKVIEGIGNAAEDVATAGADTIISFLAGIADNVLDVVNAGFDIIIEFMNGIADAIDDNVDEMREAGGRIALAIADGFTFGLASKAGDVAGAVGGFAGGIADKARGFLGIGGPSRVFCDIAHDVVAGFVGGIDDREDYAAGRVKTFGNATIQAFKDTLSNLPNAIDDMKELSPTITPILDLTSVRGEALKLSSILANSTEVGLSAYDTARDISFDQLARAEAADDVSTTSEPREISFTQINQSPEALSTADIYRQTRNQIVMAKEELGVS